MRKIILFSLLIGSINLFAGKHATPEQKQHMLEARAKWAQQRKAHKQKIQQLAVAREQQKALKKQQRKEQEKKEAARLAALPQSNCCCNCQQNSYDHNGKGDGNMESGYKY